jgi:hypothetical protein
VKEIYWRQTHEWYNEQPWSVECMVPPGWQKFWDIVEYLATLITVDLKSVKIAQGLFRIDGTCEDEIGQTLFNRVVQSIARDSATSCMVCGNRGFRRKSEALKPALCGTHYVDYLNFLADNDEESSEV